MTGFKQKHRNLLLIIWFLTLVVVAIGLIIAGLELIRQTQDSSTVVANPSFFTSPSGDDTSLSEVTDFSQIAECLTVPWEDQNGCYDNFIKAFAGIQTTREILYQLELARTSDTTIEDNCHPMTHAIGRWTYVQNGNVGDAFEACDFTCHSGCYHGVMERVFFDEDEIAKDLNHLSLDDLRDKLPTICDKQNFSNPSNSIVFQCLHGVGHAVMYSLNYDLEESLAACDLFATSYQQSSCYGGVVMENITAFEKDKRDIDLNDPHYPCNKLDDKYKSDCYLMQTSIMFEKGLTAYEIAAECSKAGEYQGTCFVSLGRDLSNQVRTGDPSFVAEVCEEYSGAYGHSYDCIAGTVYALVDNTWSGQYAATFCNRLSSLSQPTCYGLSTSYLKTSYGMTADEVRADCDQFAGANIDKCKQAINF